MGHSDWLRKEHTAKPAKPACPSKSPKSQQKHSSFTGAAETITVPPFKDKTACIKGEERQIQEVEGCVLAASLRCHINPPPPLQVSTTLNQASGWVASTFEVILGSISLFFCFFFKSPNLPPLQLNYPPKY